MQRLQKIIAAAGYCSRRKAEELISAGRVRIDNRVASLGDKADPDHSTIYVDDKPLKPTQEFCYVLLNKPTGVVTTLSDPDGRPVVTDLVMQYQARLFPVGRLDINTSGLLLMTNDGALANRLAHPRHEVDKVYLVKVRGHLSDESRKKLVDGVQLDDGMTSPAKLGNVRVSGGHTWFELTIHEGRNRQVRRMCEALGHQVNKLSRVGYAFLSLDGLAPGQSRQLTMREVQRLKKLSA